MWVFGFVPGAPFFLWSVIPFFVALRPLASIGRLKDRDPCVEKWKRCAEINNK